MNGVIGWVALIGLIIALLSTFMAWWKLRSLHKLLSDDPSETGYQMPSVTFFGSYRKGLFWVKENQNEVPVHLKQLARHTLILDKLAVKLAVALLIFAAIKGVTSI